MRAWLTYTALRLLLLVCVVAVLLVLGVDGFPLLLLALLVSSVLSLFMLGAQRAALVAAQQERTERRAADRQALRDRLDGEQPG